MERDIIISIRVEIMEKVKVHRRMRKRKMVFLILIILAILSSYGVYVKLYKDRMAVKKNEAANILYDYDDKIESQLYGTLNEADALAKTASMMEDKETKWFEEAVEPLLVREEIPFAFLFQGDTLVKALPNQVYKDLEDTKVEEFPYAFSMAKVSKDTVVEGPSLMPFDSTEEELFLFLQPILKDGVYAGEVVIAMKRAYVLEQLAIPNLVERGYDFELWQVDPQNGRKDLIAVSREGVDFSQASKITLQLPAQWNLSIQPISGWIALQEKVGLAYIGITLSGILLWIIYIIYNLVVRKRSFQHTESRDEKTGLYTQEEFNRQLSTWLAEGKSFTLFFFALEGYAKIEYLLDGQETKRYLHSIPTVLQKYIQCPYLSGWNRYEGIFVAVREEMDDIRAEEFCKGLVLELIFKYSIDDKRCFIKPQYAYRHSHRHMRNADTMVTELLRTYYGKMMKQSPVREMNEKCRQLIEGKADVVFDEYVDPDMMELSKTLNRYRKKAEEFAYMDTVFKVGNRLKYLRDANMLITYDKKRGFKLLCIDIRRFSEYNERFNAEVGDEILQEVRRRLSTFFGSYVYRINGDVFLGISLAEDKMEHIVQKVLKLFDSPIMVKSFALSINVYISACEYPDYGKQPSDLLDCLQAGLRHAKQKDKQVVIYNHALDNLLHTEADILNRLKESIRNETLEVWYQPMICLKNHRFDAAEAIVRLPDGHGSYYSAGQVIALAERNNIVEQLGDYVMKKACTFMKEYGKKLGLSRIAINLSVQQLLVENCVEHIREIMEATGVEEHNITLEVTESILIPSIEKAAKTLKELQKRGILIALDDFGVGYSSLNYLSNLPVDIIKIDRSLTKQILTNNKQHLILKSIVDMAAVNHLTVVCEGVEYADEQKVISESGVHYIQGYYYSHPMSDEKLIKFLKKNL